MGKSKTTTKLVRAPCDCLSTRGNKPKVCPHYNHKVCFPDSASEWNYQKNHPIRPEDIAPASHKIYWWICSNDKCKKSYDQKVDTRSGTKGYRCRYCAGQDVCELNSLTTTHPKLALEWDYKLNGNLKPEHVSHGHKSNVWWVCRNEKHKNEEDGMFHYPATVCNRTGRESGCPSCNSIGYEQMVGGHEEFLRQVRLVHGDKYEYPEEYSGNKTHISIQCSVIGVDNKPHGIFKQTPSDHKSGRGCRKCANEQQLSKKATEVDELFNQLGYLRGPLRIPEWSDDGKMIYVNPLRIDEYLVVEKLGTEVDGIQHFQHGSYHRHPNASFLTSLSRDLTKDIYCLRNGISLLRIPYNLPPDITKLWIQHALTLCREGYQVYFSYQHFIEQALPNIKMHPRLFVQSVPCPPLKFKRTTASKTT